MAWGTVNVKLTKILSRECAMVINLPILKDHQHGRRHLRDEEYVRRGQTARSNCTPTAATPPSPT